MRSSTSSSEPAGFVDGERRVPEARWGLIWLVVVAVAVAALGGWEATWRDRGYAADVANSPSLWNRARRAATAGDGRGTVVVGSSRVLFDLDLETWAKHVGGPQPVQLALEGTPPWTALADLGADEKFRGFLIVGYTPSLFFGGFPGERGEWPQQWRDETPSARFGQLLAMGLEQQLAFLENDAKLGSLIGRLPWPAREGLRPAMPEVPRLAEVRPSREHLMWSRLETDTAYRDHARGVWQVFMSLPMPPPTEEQIAARVAATKVAVDAIRSRGGDVLFVRCPSAGPFFENELATRPRALFWDRLLRETGAPGITFEDHPELQGFELPEWSHLRAADRVPFTAALARLAKPLYENWAQQPVREGASS